MTRDAILTLVDGLASRRQVLRGADPRDKAEVWRQLGLRLTYEPSNKRVRAEARLRRGLPWVMVRVRGGT
jgi:site-specific DNA recombinase